MALTGGPTVTEDLPMSSVIAEMASAAPSCFDSCPFFISHRLRAWVAWGGVGWGGGRMLQNPRASSRILGLAPVRLPLPAPVSLPILVESTGALICILDPSSFPGDEPEKGNLVNTAAMAKHRQASGRICRLDSRPGLIGITQRCQLL